MDKILIVSDTHGNDTWINKLDLKSYDFIIHAGDHQMQKSEIESITPYYVDGNNDLGDQKLIFFKIRNYKFMLTHGDWYLDFNYSYPNWNDNMLNLAKENKCDFVIFGHTHIPIIQKTSDVIFINPGSMSFSRHNGKKCYSELIFNDDSSFEFSEYIF
ncbi:MAG: metallophosphoesterase family protein [Mycoplasma sp.]